MDALASQTVHNTAVVSTGQNLPEQLAPRPINVEDTGLSDLLIAELHSDTLNSIVFDDQHNRYLMYCRAKDRYRRFKGDIIDTGASRRVALWSGPSLLEEWTGAPKSLVIPDEIDAAADDRAEKHPGREGGARRDPRRRGNRHTEQNPGYRERARLTLPVRRQAESPSRFRSQLESPGDAREPEVPEHESCQIQTREQRSAAIQQGMRSAVDRSIHQVRRHQGQQAEHDPDHSHDRFAAPFHDQRRRARRREASESQHLPAEPRSTNVQARPPGPAWPAEVREAEPGRRSCGCRKEQGGDEQRTCRGGGEGGEKNRDEESKRGQRPLRSERDSRGWRWQRRDRMRPVNGGPAFISLKKMMLSK